MNGLRLKKKRINENATLLHFPGFGIHLTVSLLTPVYRNVQLGGLGSH